MKTYAPVTEAVLEDLKTIVGAEYVLTEPEKLEQYQTDEETDPRKFHLPEAVVLPKDAQEIAAVIKLANTYDVPVTVRSGGTSLAGGAIPVCGGIVLLMERLNKIIELNAEGMYMEPVCVLSIFKNMPMRLVFCMQATPAALKAV